jgi:hypothetical protein
MRSEPRHSNFAQKPILILDLTACSAQLEMPVQFEILTGTEGTRTGQCDELFEPFMSVGSLVF